MPARSLTVIYVALISDILVAATKFMAASVTGSSSMFSEGVHSLVDTANEILLIYGYKRSRTPSDRHRPFGYGRELYFWSFVVSVLILAGGSGVTIYDGVLRLLTAAPSQSFS